VAAGLFAVLDSGLYAVLDYRGHHGRLPLGEVAVIGTDSIRVPLVLCFALVILLFPDGRLTRRWIWVLRVYLAFTVVAAVGYIASAAGTVAGQHIVVNLNGQYTGSGSPAGLLGVLAMAAVAIFVPPLLWPAFVVRQVLSWRRASGERRQQLKWLMSGAVLAVVGLALIAFGPPNDQLSGRVVRDLAFAALAALPVSMGVGILKYRLYDIDRRFDRTRYDGEATVAMFAARLKDAVDLNAVRDDLASVVQPALEPARISVWISPRD
jgi:two-component system, NarL family, sensor kinase